MVCSNSRLVNSLTDCVARILSCWAWACLVKSPPASLSSWLIPLAYWLLPGDDALAPGDLGHRVERGEAGHQVRARGVPVAPRAAGEDVLVVQGAEHGVDVAGHVRLAGARVARLGRVVLGAGGDPRGRGLDHGGLVLGEEVERCGLGLALGDEVQAASPAATGRAAMIARRRGPEADTVLSLSWAHGEHDRVRRADRGAPGLHPARGDARRGRHRRVRRDTGPADRAGQGDGPVRVRAARRVRRSGPVGAAAGAGDHGARLHQPGVPVAVRHEQRHRRPGPGPGRDRGAAQAVAAAAGLRRGGRVVRADRAGRGIRPEPPGHLRCAGAGPDGGWVIDGLKRYITNAPAADVFMVFARTDPEAPPGKGIGVFIVPARLDGVSVAARDHKMGQAGAWTADVVILRRAGPPRRAGRRGGRGRLLHRDAQPGARAADHRGPVRGRGGAADRRERDLRQGTLPGRPPDRRLPAGPGHAGGLADRVHGGPGAGARRRAPGTTRAPTGGSPRRRRSTSPARRWAGSPTGRCRSTAVRGTCAASRSSGCTATCGCSGSTRAPARSSSSSSPGRCSGSPVRGR